MKSITVTLNVNGTINLLTQDKLFVEEHEAAQLKVTLAGDLAAADINYHVITFLPKGSADKTATKNIYELPAATSGKKPRAYREGNILYCTLPWELTSHKSLNVQIEAHKQEGDAPTYIVKSDVFPINFGNSNTGCATEISLDVFDLLPKLHSMLEEIKVVMASPIIQSFVQTQGEVKLALPLFVPTSEINCNSERVATTAFVQNVLNDIFAELNTALSGIIGGA